jgi:intracellular septation protein
LAQLMLEKLMEGQDHSSVPPMIWKRLNLAWAAFFIVLGSLNLYVAYYFSTDVWVNFKVYGIMGILLAFSFVQAMCLTRYMSEVK